MKKLMGLGLVVLTFSLQGLAAQTAAYFDRPEVIRAGEKLSIEVEHFDESLHDANAPSHLTAKVHHFEETVSEFVAEVRSGAPYGVVIDEMGHIRADMRELRDEMYTHSDLLNYPGVYTEYRAMRTAYRWLDHAVYMGHGSSPHWGFDALENLDVDAAMAAEFEEDKQYLTQETLDSL